MNHSIKMDPVTKDYVANDQGGLEIDKGLLTPAYFRLKVQRKKWLYAPDDRYGSDYYTIKKNLTTGGNSRLRTVGEKALQPLIDDGRADSAEVELVQQARHGAGLQITIVDAQGEEEQFDYVPIGG